MRKVVPSLHEIFQLTTAAVLLLIPWLTLAQAGNVQPRIAPTIDDTRLTTLHGNTYPLAREEFDRGAAPASLPMQRMLLVLTRGAQQEAALDILLQQQQDASSANFHAWLTPQKFGQQFGPSDRDIQTVTSWLQQHGFQVTGVSNGRTVIEFSGTAGQVAEAFHTSIHSYVVNGEQHWANSSDPQIPAALAPIVAGIVTLHNFARKTMHHVMGILPGDTSTGLSHLIRPGSPTLPLYTVDDICGLDRSACYSVAPYDFARIYNVLPLWNAGIDGTGQTIAIVSQSDVYTPDFDAFRSATGLPAGNLDIIHNGPDPGIVAPGGDEGESDLDVEWAGGVAKGATLDLVVSATTNTSLGVDLSAQYVVDNNLAPILSVSYGICELFLGTVGNQFYNALWQQAAAQGITVLTASGDSGSAVCDRNAGTQGAAQFGLSVSGFSSTPYNVAVGGTDFNDLQNPLTYWNSTNDATTLASAKEYIPEMTWNDSCTNEEVISFLGLASAEATCNNAGAESEGFVNLIGASGGASNCTVSDGQNESSCSGGYRKPLWQTGVGVPNDGARDVPDVALFAADGLNANFYVMCEVDVSGDPCGNNSGTGFDFLPVGGTSVSTPAFAAIMAMVDQKTQSRQGNANYILYQLAAQPGTRCNSSNGAGTNCVFYDVTNGTIAMPCALGSPNCNISVAGDQVGILSANSTPAYNATAGYDLATGLGSVNVTNLVNQWASLLSSLKPSSTSLVLDGGNAVSITHGQNVNFTATVGAVPPATGTPTGNLSLIASTGTSGQQGLQSFVLTNGSVSSSTSDLPGGSYAVSAYYPGDGTFAMSNSSPGVNVTVNTEPSTTTVQALTIGQNGSSIPFTTGPYGAQVVYFRVNVAGQSGQGVPTGTVNFAETINGATTNLTGNPYSLNSAGYTMTPLPGGLYNFPAPGTYSLAATYNGDVSFNASNSAVNFTVVKAQTTTAATLTGCDPAWAQCAIITGSQITIGGVISESGLVSAPLPTGTETFYVNGAQVGSSVSVNSSTIPPGASLTTSQLSLGPNSIRVQYSGDTNYSGSTSALASVSAIIVTSVAITASATSIQSGQSITFKAQVTPNQGGGPAVTGTVQFLCNGSNLGSPVNVLNGEAQLSTTSLPVGLDEITAAYSGGADYGSSSIVIPVTVAGAATPTFTVTANPTAVNISAPGQSGSTMLTFTGQSGFSSNGTVVINPICSFLPSQTTCTSMSSVIIPANGTAMAQVTFNSTAASAVAPSSHDRPNTHGGWKAFGAVTLACIFSVALLALSYRKLQFRWAVVPIVSVGILIAVSTGCGGGGGGGNPGTPVGQTNPTISITINGVTETVSVTLSVR
jgi:Pro-kumamolisin, activation domain/Bacterial Ig-like domain (group 3)